SIAMALACQPRILLADEPTTALDVMVQAQILDLLARLSSELGLALVLVTHDLPVVAQTCGRAAVMYAGEIVECGPMETLFHQPRHPYTRPCGWSGPATRPRAIMPNGQARVDRQPRGSPARGRESDHPLSGTARARGPGRPPAQALGARGGRGEFHARPGRDAGPGRRVGLR